MECDGGKVSRILLIRSAISQLENDREQPHKFHLNLNLQALKWPCDRGSVFFPALNSFKIIGFCLIRRFWSFTSTLELFFPKFFSKLKRQTDRRCLTAVASAVEKIFYVNAVWLFSLESCVFDIELQRFPAMRGVEVSTFSRDDLNEKLRSF